MHTILSENFLIALQRFRLFLLLAPSAQNYDTLKRVYNIEHLPSTFEEVRALSRIFIQLLIAQRLNVPVQSVTLASSEMKTFIELVAVIKNEIV